MINSQIVLDARQIKVMLFRAGLVLIFMFYIPTGIEKLQVVNYIFTIIFGKNNVWVQYTTTSWCITLSVSHQY